jgi:hypothetical protein
LASSTSLIYVLNQGFDACLRIFGTSAARQLIKFVGGGMILACCGCRIFLNCTEECGENTAVFVSHLGRSRLPHIDILILILPTVLLKLLKFSCFRL